MTVAARPLILPLYASAHEPPPASVLARLRHGAPDGAVPLPLIAGPAWDGWAAMGDRTSGTLDQVCWTDDGHSLFLHLLVPHQDWVRDPAAATESAYRRLEAVLRQRQAPHYWRIWNYLGGITEGEGDGERYRQFTLGRHRAWAAAGRIEAPLPAATAIGCEQGLHIFALAGRVAGEAIENPRQVNAWQYPRDYGQRPPSFARAMVLRGGDHSLLLLSGTASIVGHESRHIGDVPAQLTEIRTNLATVVEAAAQRLGGVAGDWQPLNFKVYWTHEADAQRHAAALAPLQQQAPTQVLLGAVCRRELAVEVEALYRGPGRGPA